MAYPRLRGVGDGVVVGSSVGVGNEVAVGVAVGDGVGVAVAVGVGGTSVGDGVGVAVGGAARMPARCASAFMLLGSNSQIPPQPTSNASSAAASQTIQRGSRRGSATPPSA